MKTSEIAADQKKRFPALLTASCKPLFPSTKRAIFKKTEENFPHPLFARVDVITSEALLIKIFNELKICVEE